MKGPYIRQNRKRLGLSQPALGALVGTDGTSVSRWERGKVTPEPTTVEKLREVFAGGSVETTDARLARLEEKLDRLLERLPNLSAPDVS